MTCQSHLRRVFYMQHDLHFVMHQCEGCIDAIKCCVGEFSSVSKCVGPIWMAKCLSQEGTAHHDKYHPAQDWAKQK